ncbi:MAG TPA: hypothetical protein VGR46_06690 [Candidatus Limnocylindria bacterium]|nr:hypothetical protein [Candidatus Limnocylindria bacterium]
MRKWLALALVLASCGPAVATAPKALPTALPSRVPAAVSAAPSAVPLATPSPAPACGTPGAGPVPDGWTCAETTKVDLDGNGWPDVFVIFARTAPASGDAWLARIALNGGPTYEIGFAADVDDARSMIRGLVDVDRDGRDDVLVELGHGASTEIVGVFGLGKNGLAQAAYQDGTKARLLFAGSVRHGAAVECRSQSGRAELVMRGISNYTADDQWDWNESVYTWSSKVLVLTSQRKGVIKVAHPFDPPPNEDAFWSFRCFGVDLY